MTPLTSIAMATYNGACYLERQLLSISGQTRLPDELVVCDDGSTDGTLDILRAFQKQSSFEVRIYENPANLGVLRNFESALTRCRGDFVFMSDQDDIWKSEKIERVLAAFAQNPGAQIVINDKEIVDDRLQGTGATMLSNIRAFGSPDSCFVAGCCSAFRRDWIEFALPIPPGPPAHDSWLVGLGHRLSAVHILEESLQLYRRHGKNVSQNAYSSNERIGPLKRLRSELAWAGLKKGSDHEDYWNGFLQWHRAEFDRISTHLPQLARLGYGENSERALDTLRSLELAIRERLEALKLPRATRPLSILRLWSRGRYAHFSGWKSAIKDALQ